MKKYLCIDCGGTYTKYAVVQEDKTILKRGKFKAECNDLDLYIAGIRGLYEENGDVCGIAMSLPGILDTDAGIARTGGSLKCIWGLGIADIISKACGGIPVSIENDAKAAATAEAVDGVLKDCRIGLAVVIGTGIGGAVIVNGEVLRGKNLFAGELSYMYYSNELMHGDYPARTDRREQFVAERGTPRRMCQLYSLFSGHEITRTETQWLFEQYRNGDENAERAIRMTCHDLAMLIYNIQCVIDPDVVAIGGGISEEPAFIDILREEVTSYSGHNQSSGSPVPVIVPCRYNNDANIFGAYFAHRKKFG